MADERARVIDPVVPEAVAHNTQILSQLRSLSSSLFGIAAGILGLESLWGFSFYALGTAAVSFLVATQLAGGLGRVPLYFDDGASGARGRSAKLVERQGVGRWEGGAGWGIWGRDALSGLMSFVLTWTLFYGLVRS